MSEKIQPGSVALMLALILATTLRGLLWLQDRSFWLDEARLTLNIASRSTHALLYPLDYNQAAPILFLWLQRGVVELAGVEEKSLRLIPLMAGVGTVALVWSIARKVSDTRVALLATFLAAVSPSLVGASNEAKQYMFEAMAGCAVLAAGLRWFELPNRARWWWLLALGVISVWAAPSAVLVVAAVYATMSWMYVSAKESGARLNRLCIAGLCWGVSGMLAYTIVYRNVANAPYLQRYWAPAFLSPWRTGGVLNAVVSLNGLVSGPIARDGLVSDFGATRTLALSTCFLVLATGMGAGVARLLRTADRHKVMLLLAPLALVILGSVIQAYPVSARTTLFLVPTLIILLANGTFELLDRVGSQRYGSLVACMPCLLLLCVTLSGLRDPNAREHLRPLIADLRAHRALGEPVYVFAGAIPAWAIYTTDWSSPDTARLRYLRGIASSGGAAFENAPAWLGDSASAKLVYSTDKGLELYGAASGLEAHVFGLRTTKPSSGWAVSEARRISLVTSTGVWLVFAHFYGPEGTLLDALESAGARRTFEDVRNGAALFRYDFQR